MAHWLSWVEGLLIAFTVLAIWYAMTDIKQIKRMLIGRPLRTAELKGQQTKLHWIIALSILSGDLYTSITYGPESAMAELSVLGKNGIWLIVPIVILIIFLLCILILSYIMGIIAYPNGGGAYSIAKDNFKAKWIPLVASSSLLIDYSLTVAVSVSAAMEAIVSAYTKLLPYETLLAILCVFMLVFVNLRGIKESSNIFSWPMFAFMGCMITLITVGLADEFIGGVRKAATPEFGVFPEGFTTLLFLKAFSSACTALTGIETISNSVPVFRDPQQKNATKTYIAIGILTAATLLGFAFHLYVNGISSSPHNTLVSQLASTYFGRGILYQIIIWSTFIALILAANSTFTGFSQLAAIVADDGFLPRGLANRGDRLGYSNGIILLAAFASLLILGFHAHTNSLIPLFAIGVFLSFSVAQFGLIRRWLKVKGPYWQIKLVINIIGAIITSLVVVVFSVTKFMGGAWIILILLPIVISFSFAIHHHYEEIVKEISLEPDTFPVPGDMLTIVLVSGIQRIVNNSLSFAKSMNAKVIAVYIGFDDEAIHEMENKWKKWGSPCRLVCLKSKYRSLLEPLDRLIEVIEEGQERERGFVNIIIPELYPRKWWQTILHNHSALLLRVWILHHKNIAVTTIPFHMKK